MLFAHKTNAPTWIAVFLGNPGAQYEHTRHNAGFMTADILAADKGLSIDRARFRALTAVYTMGNENVLIMKPQTFMNLSGQAVAEAMHFYKIPPEHIIVVSDEVSLAPGRIRVRTNGSAGGHNGLKSIIACAGTDRFPRIRIGVGSPTHPDYAMADWVLGHFNASDLKLVEDACKRAAAAVESYITKGADDTMTLYNRLS